MVECVRHGHELVALANLHPKKDIGNKLRCLECSSFIRSLTDELDSYMYQSVGHEMIDLIAQAMELPLYRAEIKGDAQTTDKQYEQPVEGDEVEDLFELLAEIKASERSVDRTCQDGCLLDLAFRTNMRSKPFPSVLFFPSIKTIELLTCKSLLSCLPRR